jgi:hypothetical protein
VHAIPFTITKEFTIGTLSVFHPSTIAKKLETVCPYFPKIILINIPLTKVTPDAGTGETNTDTYITRKKL